MRSLVFTASLLIVGALAAGSGFSATIPGKSKMTVPDPPAPSVDGLRGPLDPSTAPLDANLSLGNTPSMAAAANSLTVGRAIAALTPSPVSPLKPVGDPAPICRTQCAETRYICATTETSDCDSKWSQCVADCSIPASR